MKLRVLLGMLLIGSFLLAACGQGQEPTEGEVFVFVAAPLSGFQANGGQTVLGGVRLMAARLNQGGGLLGHEVSVVGMDDESDSDVAVTVAEEIRDAVQGGQQILGVIGHYNSGQTLAAMEVYKDLPLVVITPTASEMSLTQKGYRNFFRVNANDEAQARVDAEFLVNTLNARRVAVVFNDDP
jgi:branched-chain amino acid transport system substrate-binding protein